MTATPAAIVQTPKDSLGCAKADLAIDHVLHSHGTVFRRKAAPGRHISEVETSAQSRGLLVGVSLAAGHRRTGWTGGRGSDLIYDPGDIYIRDFENDYRARMDGSFDFFLIELPAEFTQDADELEPGCSRSLTRPQAQRDEVLRHLAHAVLPALADPGAADPLFVEQLSTAIGAHLMRGYGGATRSRTAHRLAPSAIRRAQEMLMASEDEQASIARIAHALNLPRNTFFRAFRQATGVSPYQWLLNQRIARARGLLVATDLPLAEIALTCGFSDQSHFTRIFRRTEGLSPGRWRGRAR